MRAALLICLLLSLTGALLRLLLKSAGADAAARTVAALCSVLALLALAQGVRGGVQVLPHVEFQDQDARFRRLSEETWDAVYREAEQQLAKQLCAGVAERCGHTPQACSASIDRERLSVSAVTVVFDADDRILSSYEVRQYIRSRCGAEVNVEVVFE